MGGVREEAITCYDLGNALMYQTYPPNNVLWTRFLSNGILFSSLIIKETVVSTAKDQIKQYYFSSIMIKLKQSLSSSILGVLSDWLVHMQFQFYLKASRFQFTRYSNISQKENLIITVPAEVLSKRFWTISGHYTDYKIRHVSIPFPSGINSLRPSGACMCQCINQHWFI